MTKITEQQIRELFRLCQDVTIQSHDFTRDGSQSSVIFIYSSGLCDTKQIYQSVLPSLHELFQQTQFKKSSLEQEHLWTKQKSLKDVENAVFSGQLVLHFPDSTCLFSMDLAKPPERQPTASQTEPPIYGPGDSFVENLTINRAIIRKRLKTNSLKYEEFTIGRRSQAKVGLFYVDDIISLDIIKEVKKRLSKINIDALSSINQLGHLITRSSSVVVPLFSNTTRPDFVMDSLLSGRFVLFAEGFPSAIICPMTLPTLLHIAEDGHHSTFYVSLTRLLRRGAMFIAILLPGFWMAVSSYHLEQIPLPLLASITISRQGIPIPMVLEFFLVAVLFDILVEAGARFPQSIGQAVTIIGGLIIGETTIQTGLATPSTLVIVAISTTAGFTAIGQMPISLVVPFMRYYILLLSSFLGLFGFFFGMFSLLLYLATLKSFGIPYLAPFSPLVFKDILASQISLPWNKKRERPHMLHVQDSTKGEEEE